MSSTNSRYLAVASGHIDSLISYVLDVKPYHVKLSEIVEQYLFNDTVNVKIVEDNQTLGFLGADIMPAVKTSSTRARRAISWLKDYTSDGSRTTWPVPYVALPKFASQASLAGEGFNSNLSLAQDAFVMGYERPYNPILDGTGEPTYDTFGNKLFYKSLDNDLQIPGIQNIPSNGVFNQTRWDGPSIPSVLKNGKNQQESFDYFLSHGVFSFSSRAGQYWKELNLSVHEDDPKLLAEYKADFPIKTAALFYNPSIAEFGKILDITGGLYDEWTLACIDDYIELKIKTSAIKAFSNVNLTLSGQQTVNGIAVIDGDIVLVKDQSISSQNSLYQVSTGAWTRVNASNYKTILALSDIGLENEPELVPYTWVATGLNPGIISVTGKYTGLVGTCLPNSVFTYVDPLDTSSVLFSFTYSGSFTRVISPGEKFVLTPFNKITVAPDAPEEDWSIIKTNPIVIKSKPRTLPGAPGRTILPTVIIHTKSLDSPSQGYFWTLQFDGAGNYNLKKNDGVDNSVIISQTTVSLSNGMSYQDDEIHFTVVPGDGIVTNDIIRFETAPTAENMLVYGSVSGWQPNATFGEWYWNGKVGFKVPKLEYFAKLFNSTIATSETADDGTWTTTVSNSQVVRNITFQNGTFFITGDNSIAGSSVDGKNWVSGSSTELFTPDPLHPQNRLIVIGQNGRIYTTLDGINWLNKPTHTTQNLNATTQIPDLLYPTDVDLVNPPLPSINCIIVVGNNGTILTSTSTNSWVIQPSGTSENLNDIAWSTQGYELTDPLLSAVDKPMIIVGDNGTILRSTNRADWAIITAPPGTGNLRAVIYERTIDKFIAVGDNGTILTSDDDGLTWLNLSVLSNGLLTDICYGDGQFTIVSIDGVTATSTDGSSWTSYIGKPFNAIAYGNGKWVAVGGRVSSFTQFIPIKPVNSVAEPSEYTITFVDSENASVFNNIYGFRKGLKVNTPWDDGYASFRIDTVSSEIPYQFGDEIKVYLAPRVPIYLNANSIGFDQDAFDADDTEFDPESNDAHYDDYDYQFTQYDDFDGVYDFPRKYNEEVFPFYHSHGSVIFKATTRPNSNDVYGNPTIVNNTYGIAVNDKVLIDKAFFDKVRFKIINGGVAYPELAAVQDWIPLEFRLNANFPDQVTNIDAYLGSKPDEKVFSIVQPAYGLLNNFDSATVKFDPTFLSKYLKFNTKFSLMFLPEHSYSQTIRVKITENLTTYSKVHFIFDDIIRFSFDDTHTYNYTVSDMSFVDNMYVGFVEGGALPFAPVGYDLFLFDVGPYESRFPNGITNYMAEIPPGSQHYEWTADPNTWVSPNLTDSPGIFVERTPEVNSFGAGITEGLSIREKEIFVGGVPIVNEGYDTVPYDVSYYPYDIILNFPPERLSLIFDMTLYPSGLIITESSPQYLITVLNRTYSGTPNLIVESIDTPGLIENPIPNMFPFPQLLEVFSQNSFTFETSITTPFRLSLV